MPVMGNEDQSLASFTTCAREKLGDLTCVLIVEVADRLVGENERGVVDESPGNRDALLLSAAQFGRPVPGAIAKTDGVEELLGAPGRRSALWKNGEKDVLDRCKLREQVVGLEDEPDALLSIERCRGPRQASDVRAADNNLAAIGAVQCGNEVDPPPAGARSRPPGLYRRDLGHHQYGTPLWPGRPRVAAIGPGAKRALEGDDPGGRSAGQRRHRALRL
jgi:hypothetical protein